MIQVVVVEDDPDIREATLEFLEMEGISAIGCENGRVALDTLRRWEGPYPHLLLVDLAMPVLGGVGFREEQLKDSELNAIPCAIMSADGQIDARCRELGIARNLKKPVDLDELLSFVREFIDG